jgi:hypothetical protein
MVGMATARSSSREGRIAGAVVGVYSCAQRVVSYESAMLIPENTALAGPREATTH